MGYKKGRLDPRQPFYLTILLLMEGPVFLRPPEQTN